jgi:hypothetical protein
MICVLRHLLELDDDDDDTDALAGLASTLACPFQLEYLCGKL